ncbi:phage holin family protein [Klenkia sp. LSe6-5]|uniref:Phage holin family protein n=1 Tax=Klenkia sesuvii TaxID=3103137 RepID=A0ABU8DW19_9ACTN
MTGPDPREDRPDVEGTPVGELIGEVSRDLSTLVRQELALARAELTAEAKKAGVGAGMLGGAGYAGHLTVLSLSLALWAGLASAIRAGWAALVVAAIWAVVAAVLFVVGRGRLKGVDPKPERTVETLQRVPDAVTPRS